MNVLQGGCIRPAPLIYMLWDWIVQQQLSQFWGGENSGAESTILDASAGHSVRKESPDPAVPAGSRKRLGSDVRGGQSQHQQ